MGMQVQGAFAAAREAVCATGAGPFSGCCFEKYPWGMQVQGAFTAAWEAVSAQANGPSVGCC